MTNDDFEKLVTEAILNIPEKFRKLMENVAITTEDSAREGTAQSIKIKRGDILLGLYEGVPRTKRGPNYGMVPPDKITIFREPIEMIGQTAAGIKNLVRETVIHEVGHHFGLSDEALHRAERK